MKKLLIWILFFIIPLWVFAATPETRVFKIESYTLNEITNTYELYSYGSSVLVWDWLVYTNAHVVLDEDWEPLWNYRVCKTIDFRKKPVCFSVWKLLYYDENNDLAVLKIWDPKVNPVSRSKINLEIWNQVKVYWYPSNWWNTISYTEWKISWYENWFYKIDANLDEWNSWWWVFNSSGYLVWIVSSIKLWYTTMWYFIPMDKLESFMNKKSLSITNYDEILSSDFVSFDNSLRNVFSNSKYDWKDFSTDYFSKYSLQVYDYNVDTDKKFYDFYLSDKEENNFLSVSNLEYMWNDSSLIDYFVSYYNETSQIEVDEWYLKVYRVDKVKYKTLDAVRVLKLYNNWSFRIILKLEKDLHNYLDLQVVWYKWVRDVNLNKALNLAFRWINIKKEVDLSNPEKTIYEVDNLLVSKIKGFIIESDINWEYIYNIWNDIMVYWPEVSVDLPDYQNQTLSDILKDSYELIKSDSLLNNYQINQTKSGLNYIYSFWEYSSLESSKKYFIYVIFFTKYDDDYYYKNSITFSFDNKDSKIMIDDFINNLHSESNENFFEIWDLKIRENLIKKPSFNF